MADLFDSFLHAFALQEAQKKAIAGASPYAGLKQGSATINDAILSASTNPDFSTGEKIAAGLLGGLIGGGLNSVDQSWQARARDEYKNAALAGMLGRKAERDLLPQSIFDVGTEAGELYRARSVFDQAQREAELEKAKDLYKFQKEADLDMAREEIYLEKPWLKDIQPMATSAENPAAGALPIATKIETGTSQAGGLSWPAGIGGQGQSLGGISDDQRVMEGLRSGRYSSPSEGYKDLRDEVRRLDQDEDSFQKQFLTTDVVKDFLYKKRGLSAFMEAYADPHATSDYELVRRAAQAVEVGLAVRKDDQDAILESTSVLGEVGAKARRALEGGSGLSDDIRAGLARTVKRSYEADLPIYNEIRNKFLAEGQERGYNPEFVVPYGEGVSFDEMFPDVAIGATAPTIEQRLSRGYQSGGTDGALKALAAEYKDKYGDTEEARRLFKQAAPQVIQLFEGQ